MTDRKPEPPKPETPKPETPKPPRRRPPKAQAEAQVVPAAPKPRTRRTKPGPSEGSPGQLDLLQPPIPPVVPQPTKVEEKPSVVEASARYPRRPPPPVQPARETLSMADRARRMGQHHRPVEASAVERPKPLDMGEIAARNRMARHAVRDERVPEPRAMPTAAPSAEPRLEAGRSMAERAARHSLIHRVEDKPQAPPPPPIVQPPQPVVDDDVSMAERAAEAVRRRRDAHGPAQIAPPLEPLRVAGRAQASSTAVVLVTRNHAGIVKDRLRAWQRLLEAIDTRWFVLDLGSTDDSVAEAEAAHVQVLRRPGGLVRALATVDVAVRLAGADVVLIIEAAAEPHPSIIELAGVVRAGHVAAVAPERHPVALAVASQAWLAAARATDLDGVTRARRSGGLRRLAGGGQQPRLDGLVARAVEVPAWRGWLHRAEAAVAMVRKLLRR
jgi:hypothetical protein